MKFEAKTCPKEVPGHSRIRFRLGSGRQNQRLDSSWTNHILGGLIPYVGKILVPFWNPGRSVGKLLGTSEHL